MHEIDVRIDQKVLSSVAQQVFDGLQHAGGCQSLLDYVYTHMGSVPQLALR